MDQNEKNVHEIKMSSRAALRISGVEDVIGFDDNTVALSTCMGILTIEGSALHISKLDVSAGNIELNGKIDTLYYSEPSAGRHGLFKRAQR